MLKGKPVVFLSCSEKFKHRVARPIREGLREHGIFGVIVSDEPSLPRVAEGPDAKVDSYLDASDAFVALRTPDDESVQGVFTCRQNVISEIERARARPGLRSKIMVLKEDRVQLPSNINPTYLPLALDDMRAATRQIIEQLEAWQVLDQAQHTPGAARPDVGGESLAALLDGMHFADHDEAGRRAYAVLRAESRVRQLHLVATLVDRLKMIDADDDNEDLLRHAMLLEAFSHLDPTLVSDGVIDELSLAGDMSRRMTAAMLLWDRAEAAPDSVPLGIVGRLALPATEDWYVQAPAMAVVKQLVLQRRTGRIVLDHLAESVETEDRFAVAAAILDIASVNPAVAPRDLAEKLATDADELVAAKATEALEAIGERREDAPDPRSPFGL
jgi:Predicted nucleotide-binding protein containing TIR-like domain